MKLSSRKYLLGNEAIAHGLLEAGVSVVSGYPGTPSSEIIPFIARTIEHYDKPPHVEWSVNEKVALEVAAGASYCNCLLYTSDAADDLLCVDLGGRRIIKKKKKRNKQQ